MAKRKSASYMTPGEQIAGTVFFVIYLVVLPFATAPLFRLAERLLDASISPSLQNAIYYYTLFALLRSSFSTAFWAAPPGILRTIWATPASRS